MTRVHAPRRDPRPARHATTIRLALGLGLTLVLAGGLSACAPTAPAPSATATATSATSVSPTSAVLEPTPVPTSAYHPLPTPAATPPSKTRTSWGVIWDALPRGFPTPPAAAPTETGDPEPASATLAVPTAAAATTEWYRSALPAAGYSIESVNGPYENGGYVIDAVGTSPDCRVQLSLARTGTTTTVTILFAAACPFRA
jgi:hypothetical protein